MPIENMDRYEIIAALYILVDPAVMEYWVPNQSTELLGALLQYHRSSMGHADSRSVLTTGVKIAVQHTA